MELCGYLIYPVNVFVKMIMSSLKTNEPENDQGAGKANRQTGNIKNGVQTITSKITPSDFEIIFDHNSTKLY
ncbi:hypothetical protein LZG71_00835 [Dyadobacter sp. CY312]|nr:hypothetical protein [Dyadobacter sp. CY312]